LKVKDICLIKKGKNNYYMKVKKSYLRKINILKSLNDNIKNKVLQFEILKLTFFKYYI